MLWRRGSSNRELLERIESLERRFKTLLADVDEYFHLVRRAENRMAKKAMVESEQAPETGPAEIVPELPGLTSRQSKAQQAILSSRRSRLIVRPPNGGE